MGYLLSIVVPIKDRYFYLKHLDQIIKSFDSVDIALVIHDNTSVNIEFLGCLKDLGCSHVNFFCTKCKYQYV